MALLLHRKTFCKTFSEKIPFSLWTVFNIKVTYIFPVEYGTQNLVDQAWSQHQWQSLIFRTFGSNEPKQIKVRDCSEIVGNNDYTLFGPILDYWKKLTFIKVGEMEVIDWNSAHSIKIRDGLWVCAMFQTRNLTPLNLSRLPLLPTHLKPLQICKWANHYFSVCMWYGEWIFKPYLATDSHFNDGFACIALYFLLFKS